MIIVADTTPIITLLKIDKLSLLEKLFGKIIVPKAVFRELTQNNKFVNEADIITKNNFIEVQDVSTHDTVELFRKSTGLDAGESEALVLAEKLQADMMLLDEKKARKMASLMNIKVMGTVGILIKAYEKKIISKDEILVSVNIMKSYGRFVSESVYEELFRML